MAAQTILPAIDVRPATFHKPLASWKRKLYSKERLKAEGVAAKLTVAQLAVHVQLFRDQLRQHRRVAAPVGLQIVKLLHKLILLGV